MTLTPHAKAALLAARARSQEEQLRLRTMLADQYSLAPDSPGFQVAWDYAWEQGHSAGCHEVALYFHDIMRVVHAFQGSQTGSLQGEREEWRDVPVGKEEESDAR